MFEFGPWLRAVAPKTRHKKGNSSPHRYSHVEEEDSFLSIEEEDADGGDKLHQQPLKIPLTDEFIRKMIRGHPTMTKTWRNT